MLLSAMRIPYQSPPTGIMFVALSGEWWQLRNIIGSQITRRLVSAGKCGWFCLPMVDVG